MLYNILLRNFFTYFVLMVILCTFFFPACKKIDKTDSNILKIGIEVNPTNLDPRFSLDAASSRVTQVVFNGLVKRNSSFDLVPDLAERWEQPDKFTYVFFLREGVRFHNGEELTAYDVKYTISSILDPSYKSPKKSGYLKIKSIDVLDKYTIKFVLNEVFAPFLENMTIGIVPAKEAEQLKGDFAYRPVGTGPFKLVKWLNDEKLVFEANNDYFEGAPKLKGLVYKIILDETIRLLELEQGNIDLLQNSVPPDFFPRVKKNSKLKMQKVTGTNFSYMGFNFEDSVLKDKRVRQAISYGIDRQKIIKYILKSSVSAATGLISPLNRFYESDVTVYPYNPEKAIALLEEAGYKDPDGKGPKPRLTLVYKTSQNELRKLIAEVIQSQLKDIGIDMSIKSYEWGTFFSDIKSGNFQLYSLTWVGISDPDIYHYIFHSSSVPPNGANRGRYINPFIDKLLNIGRKKMDILQRKKIYSKVQKIIAEDAVYVNLWYSENIAVMRKEVEGFVVYPDEGLYSLKDVYFKASGLEKN